MGLLITFMSIWIFTFMFARLFSLFGGRWSLFAKTYWQNDIVICFGQSLLITLLLEMM
ncbi:hypothetical protein [Bacillus sp. AG4(2022)]|uniref:hypothetical protein n=1 Tax=Bacillus sp. AG4(2022) TaxID=2962594 RepID=UPI002881D488|nr:hypothetical protein [Bacillus sp. AG4(2022)]MDT0161247.1 hypothetical protein [Bacillus sp. AG4(2022)]